VYIPDTMDQSNVDYQQAFKQKVMKRMLPEVEWDMYDKLFNEFKDEYTLKQLEKPTPTEEDDQFGNQY
jgi:hypothetical protein